MLKAARSGGLDRAKNLAMCDNSDNCTDGSSFTVTPQTYGPQPVHVDMASNNSRLTDRLAEVKACGNSPVTKAPAVMPNDYDQIAEEFVDLKAKEFEEKIARDDMMSKVLEKPEPLKLIENPTEIPEGHKVGASSLNWEEQRP